MRINADFSVPVCVAPADYQWVASPQAGVERVMLDRVGEEVARATSLVRYAQGSNFPAHRHPGGEEILVLEGTFSDEKGDYPAGWYLRNPPASSHSPHSHDGALILVKLCQMQPSESQAVRVNSNDAAHWHEAGGREICPLFTDGQEHVFLERLGDAALLAMTAPAGMEVFVVSGELGMAGQRYGRGSWIRLPAGDRAPMQSLGGCTLFVKTGHFGADHPPQP